VDESEPSVGKSQKPAFVIPVCARMIAFHWFSTGDRDWEIGNLPSPSSATRLIDGYGRITDGTYGTERLLPGPPEGSIDDRDFWVRV